MKISWIFFFFFLVMFLSESKAQNDTLIQFSGVIRNLKYEPIPDVHIINLTTRSGTTGNENGIYSFIVNPSDSILFRCLGYKYTLVIIPDQLSDRHYPRDVYMLNDTIKLAEIKIFPWKTYQEFKVAFIKLDLPDDDYQRAVRNIALVKAQLNMDFEPDSDLSYKYAMQQNYEKLYYNGQFPSYTIFNPLNWAKFFSALKNGDFKSND